MFLWILKMWLNSSAREISINDSLYFHEFWRCNWVMLEKSLSIVANIFMNSRCNWINAVSWVIERWDFVSWQCIMMKENKSCWDKSKWKIDVLNWCFLMSENSKNFLWISNNNWVLYSKNFLQIKWWKWV